VVSYLIYLYSSFLVNFSSHSFFERFSRFDETCQTRIEPCRPCTLDVVEATGVSRRQLVMNEMGEATYLTSKQNLFLVGRKHSHDYDRIGSTLT
jgi:hypothetical protein